MALLWTEGWEWCGTTNGDQISIPAGQKYSATANATALRIADGRFGGKAIFARNVSPPTVTTPVLGSDTEWTVGVAIKPGPTWADAHTLVSLFEGASTQGMNIRSTATGAIEIRRGATLLATSATGILTQDNWTYIEFKCLIDNSAGEYEVRADGVAILGPTTGVDTQAGSGVDRVRFNWSTSGTDGDEIYTDDMYVLDSTGSTNNDFLGPDVRVVAIFPNAAGDSTDFTPSAGDNWENVDDNPTDSDTTHVESGTAGHLDLYNYTAVEGIAGTIYGIQISTVARETDATQFNLITHAKTGSTDDEDAGQALTGSYTTPFRVLEEDPDTASAWTVAGLNGAQFGFEAAAG
jgi:hypothetical protein